MLGNEFPVWEHHCSKHHRDGVDHVGAACQERVGHLVANGDYEVEMLPLRLAFHHLSRHSFLFLVLILVAVEIGELEIHFEPMPSEGI